jgi:hypothetical protein
VRSAHLLPDYSGRLERGRQQCREQSLTDCCIQMGTGRRAGRVLHQRKFAFEVKSNGSAASVLLQRLMTVNELAEPRKKRTTRRKGKRHNGQGTDPYDEVYSRLPDGYRPSVLIGIDPGMRNLCTVAIAGRLPRRTRKRSAWSKDLRRRNRIARKRRHLRGQRIVEISTQQYRHMAMINKTSNWHKNLQKREPWYAGICHAMPSFKTSNLELYVERLAFFWGHVGFLLTFTTEHAFLKYRFLQDRMKMKALDALAERIVPVPSPQVCIAFGDWSRRGGIKGHPSGPVKGSGRPCCEWTNTGQASFAPSATAA